MISGIIHLRSQCHRRRREVLYLLQLEMQALGDHRQLRHIRLGTSRMAGNEIGDELLVQPVLPVYLIEYLLELSKLRERRFTHLFQHLVLRMLRGHFQTAGYVAGD